MSGEALRSVRYFAKVGSETLDHPITTPPGQPARPLDMAPIARGAGVGTGVGRRVGTGGGAKSRKAAAATTVASTSASMAANRGANLESRERVGRARAAPAAAWAVRRCDRRPEAKPGAGAWSPADRATAPAAASSDS